jgi:hypothetical protein
MGAILKPTGTLDGRRGLYESVIALRLVTIIAQWGKGGPEGNPRIRDAKTFN